MQKLTWQIHMHMESSKIQQMKWKRLNVTINKTIKKWLTLMMLQNKALKNNPNWPQIPDHPYRILIIAGFESGKKSLFNLMNK